VVGGAALVGAVADPERNFSLRDFPLWRGEEPPELPLNL
jgi:hypothetical protein